MTVRTSFYLTSYVIDGPIQIIGMVANLITRSTFLCIQQINLPKQPCFQPSNVIIDSNFPTKHKLVPRTLVMPKTSNNQTKHSNDMVILLILEPTFALQQYPIIFGIEPQLQLLPCLRSNKTNGSSEGVISLFHGSIIV